MISDFNTKFYSTKTLLNFVLGFKFSSFAHLSAASIVEVYFLEIGAQANLKAAIINVFILKIDLSYYA